MRIDLERFHAETGSSRATTRLTIQRDSPRGRCHRLRFEIVHRRRCYGPFRVEWAVDLTALELRFDKALVASIGITPAAYADLSGQGLPDRVRQLAVVVFAAAHESLNVGLAEEHRCELIGDTLEEHGLSRFRVVDRRASATK